jgi:hypothetical protein
MSNRPTPPCGSDGSTLNAGSMPRGDQRSKNRRGRETRAERGGRPAPSAEFVRAAEPGAGAKTRLTRRDADEVRKPHLRFASPIGYGLNEKQKTKNLPTFFPSLSSPSLPFPSLPFHSLPFSSPPFPSFLPFSPPSLRPSAFSVFTPLPPQISRIFPFC